MNPTKSRSDRPATCANCAGNDLQRQITTYPVRLTGPGNLAGKEIHVGGVTLYECQYCGHRMPTPTGQVKVDRCVTQAIGCCDRPGCYEQFIRKITATKVLFEGVPACDGARFEARTTMATDTARTTWERLQG